MFPERELIAAVLPREPRVSPMRIAILTNEYPPHIYGGAGVHVEYLTRELIRAERANHTVQVLCFGDQHERAGSLSVDGVTAGTTISTTDPRHGKFFDTMLRDLQMAGALDEVDIVHCHTWYTHFAGCLVKQLTGAKLVLTTHSLEPHRPWKVEQLGTAYNASSWIERTAYQNADGVIAVSQSMRDDVHNLYGVPNDKIRVIHNGIDLNQYRPTPNPAVLAEARNPRRPPLHPVRRSHHPAKGDHPSGRGHPVPRTRHPGRPVRRAPDTPEIGREMAEHVEQARMKTQNPIVWIPEILPKDEIISIYTDASIFVCPSVYEPFGIINLEAMACGTAVVAVGRRRYQGGRRTRTHRPSRSLRGQEARPISSRSTPNASAATSRKRSIDSWPTRKNSDSWAGTPANGSSITLAGPASPGSRSIFTGTSPRVKTP